MGIGFLQAFFDVPYLGTCYSIDYRNGIYSTSTPRFSSSRRKDLSGGVFHCQLSTQLIPYFPLPLLCLYLEGPRYLLSLYILQPITDHVVIIPYGSVISWPDHIRT